MLVRRKLAALSVDPATYKRVSLWKPRSSSGAAARLLYLNRTAYGGLYRENSLGLFNVPFSGDRNLDPVLRDDRLELTGAALAKAELVSGDFAAVLARAEPGALVFCDPPYSLPGAEKGFRRYNCLPFSWDDQVRLAARARLLAEGGSTVLVSNSCHELVRDLYSSAQLLPLVRKSTLARGPATEQKEAIYVLHADSAVSDAISDVLAEGLG